METKEVTLSTGVVVRVKPIPPILLDRVMVETPKPKPPVQKTDMGEIPNPDHPAYLEELQDYYATLNRKSTRLLLELGTEVDVDRDEVAAFREMMGELEPGTRLSGSDKYIYLAYIKIATKADMDAVMEGIKSTMEPSEEEVAVAVATFRPDAAG